MSKENALLLKPSYVDYIDNLKRNSNVYDRLEDKLCRITEDQIAKWREEEKQHKEYVEKERDRVRCAISTAKKALIDAMKAAPGYNTYKKEIAYINKIYTGGGSFYFYELKSTILDKIESAKKALKDKQDKIDREKAVDLLTTEAITWLISRGKVLGVDFTVSNAISIANSVACDEEIKRLSEGVDYHDFEGNNCSDCGSDWNDGKQCLGWDGVSRRCECGNRRVSWETSDYHSFKNPHVRAVAY